MNIHEVESIVSLSKKSIRLYEDEGLITPNRNKENGYRIYTDKDINDLRKIKFLRELNVPIKDIKELKNHNITLKDCIQDRIKKIESEEENYKKIKTMCNEIIDSELTYDLIDITEYFQNVRVLNKEGFTMRKVKTNKGKKIVGAIISSSFFVLFFGGLIAMISYFNFTESDAMPLPIYIIFMSIFGLPLISIVYNLVLRIKEIIGGEEDEASKY